MSTQRQNPDGSYSPAEPIPWQPGIDWEVYGPNPRTGRTDYEAVAYDEDVCVAVVRSRWKPLLNLRIALKHRQVSR